MGNDESIRGTWPENCLQRAFVDGASWWQFHTRGTMYASEREQAEAEAVKRFGAPQGTPPTPELEPGEFFITRGDGVQERCRYVGQSIKIPATAEALPDKCPTCGSDKPSYTNSGPRDRHWICTHPWHSSAATQKEK